MNNFISLCLLGAVCSMLPAPALALELAEGRVHLNTYGTLGVATLSGPDVELFRSTATAGPSLDHSPSMDFDSRLGLQLEANLTDQVGVVWQGLLHRDLDDDTSLDTKWAFVRYSPTPWLDIKLGRFLTPFYQISDQMYVGYAQPWVRPPQEVYGLIGQIDSSDGLMLRFRLPTEGYNTTLDTSISQYTDSSSGVDVAVRPLITAVLTASRDDWTVRAMAARAPIHASGSYVDSLNALLQAPGASHRYDISGEDDVWYFNLGFKYQNTDWYASAEYVRTSINGNYALPEDQAVTVTVGHYWGKWMPYVTYSKLDVLNTAPETGLGGAGQLAAQGLIDARKNDQSTLGLGVRWDFHPGYALKAQVDSIRTPGGQRGLFDTDPSGTVRVYSLALEWAL